MVAALSIAAKPEATVVVPDVRGSSLDEGFSTLRSRGLCVAFSKVHLADNIGRRISAQRPKSGTEARPGSVIRLSVDVHFGRPAASPGIWTVPDLVGLTLGRAVSRLDEAHLRYWEAGLAVSLPPSRAPTLWDAFSVARQSPAAGTRFRQRRRIGKGVLSISPVRMRLRQARSTAC